MTIMWKVHLEDRDAKWARTYCGVAKTPHKARVLARALAKKDGAKRPRAVWTQTLGLVEFDDGVRAGGG